VGVSRGLSSVKEGISILEIPRKFYEAILFIPLHPVSQ
jgi:hypothetical protein